MFKLSKNNFEIIQLRYTLNNINLYVKINNVSEHVLFILLQIVNKLQFQE
jgi:hypothetical protein